MTLEQQLFALLDQHNLSSLSIQVLRVSDDRRILNATAQGNGKCASNKIGDTSSEVVGSAISELNAIRNPACEPVTTFEPMDIAA